MKTRYQFRFYPTEEQKAELAKVFGCCRYVYNRALRYRTDAWQNEKKSVSYKDTSKIFTQWRKEEESEWLSDVPYVPCQQSLRNLNNAFVRFFKKLGDYPRFKKRSNLQSATYAGNAFKFSTPDPNNPNLKVTGLGRLNVRWSRKFESVPTTVTIIKRPSGRYFVTLVLDEEFSKHAPTGKTVGIDLGISRFATLSDGTRIPNPKHTSKNQGRLAKAQRELSRKVKGSGRYNRQRIRVAKIQEYIANCRKDHLDKVSSKIVQDYDCIIIEDLNVRGMIRNRCLSKAIADVSWGMFRTMLEYKCERYGRELRLVDRFFPSSKMCNECNHVVDKLPLDIREWDCPECGAHHDRDLNASKVIHAEGGQPFEARGAKVRRCKSSGLQRILQRNVNHPVVGILN